MTNHTPGPWAWEEVPGRSVLRAAHGDVFGHAHYEGLWPGAYDVVRDAANMRLVCAAPLMFEALANLENDDGTIPDHAWRLVQNALHAAKEGDTT